MWRDVSGAVGGGGSDGRWTVVSSDNTVIWALPLSNHDAGTNTKSKSKGRSRGRRQWGFGLVTDVS